ncbi:hypothetical protein [Mucilaginibacter sp.]|uniref:hypothetical protein n=1 Tax=Mucilaginibacter sp. TaxID=1882438 RepID=UPI002620B6D6|nr:hypothetical protein [Mucilaginibacter sp.]
MKKLISLTSLFLLSCLTVFAQETKKLKEVQAANLWAPSPIKIDGVLKEWGDSFQAYNKATKLYYTISNDDKNIYLAIKSTDAVNNNKVTAGGITLTINTDGKKKEKDAFSLTYPVIQRPTRTMRGPGVGGPGGGGRSVAVTDVVVTGGPGGPGGQTVDSAMIKAAHERTIAAAKEIKVAGFKDITDSLVSIYNEYGIKAAIGYNAMGNFTYEMAIPIKLLNLKSDGQELNYNVKVNGIVIPAAMMQAMSEGGNGGGGGDGQRVVMFGGPGGGGGGPRGGGASTFQEMTSPSDFWGKYTLAKK